MHLIFYGYKDDLTISVLKHIKSYSLRDVNILANMLSGSLPTSVALQKKVYILKKQ